jgi:hypothetical protein
MSRALTFGALHVKRVSPGLLLMTLFGALAFPTPAEGQLTWQDLVFTGGLSAEGYRGNLPAVTLTAVDSTEKASAAVGELGLRGSLVLLDQEDRTVTLQFDTGLRQFVAGGFKLSSYAPKELVGRIDLTYREQAGSLGEVLFYGGVSGRSVTNRPPMPLFIQPGFSTVDARVQLRLPPVGSVLYDAQLFGEMARYSSTEATPQLALLDRKAAGLEVGATWGPDWTVRGYAGFRYSEYENQGTFDPKDPLRRDKTFNLGGTWTLRSSVLAQIGVEGGLNRSNSSRPEYNALRVRGFVAVPIGRDLNISFSADITAKDYLTDTGDALLIPGEEADNASVVYVEASRPLFLNLDGALRFGWTRAERNIGDEYYERFGGSLLFRYRPFN